MIANIFKKSTPFNYIIIALMVVVVFSIVLLQNPEWFINYQTASIKTALILVLIASIIVSNFIAKKNILTRDSAFVLLFFVLLYLFFPEVFYNQKLIVANFFILMAMRRLVSLQTLKAPKEKILDASLWILAASILHFWCILYFVLVYSSIIFHVSRDYRNWLIPVFSTIIAATVFIFISLISNHNQWIFEYINSATVSFTIDYFTNNYQNIAFSIFAVLVLFFVTSAIFSLPSKPLNLQASYKKLVLGFFIGVAIFILSPNKSNAIFIFTYFPLSVMITNYIEYSQNKVNQNLALILIFIAAVFNFAVQL